MPSPIELNGEMAAWGGVGLLALGIAGRAALTWLGRQNLISAGDSSQKDLLKEREDEAAKWKSYYELEKTARDLADRAHDDAQQMIGELRVHNLLLKSLLLQRGMTQTELDTILGLIK